MKEETKKNIFYVVVLILSPLSYTWNGYVFVVLWNWFIFQTGLVHFKMIIPIAIGLFLIKGILFFKYESPKVEDLRKLIISYISTAYAVPGSLLLVGLIVKQFLAGK